MKALVTGATGLLGNNLVRLLLQEGVAVRAMSPSAERSRALEGLDVERVAADIRDPDAVARATRDVDAVFNCAGCVRIGWSHRAEHESINHLGAKHVADAVRGKDIRLVHVSTVNALGLAPPKGLATEDDYDERITPCPYITSKRAGQNYVLSQVEAADLDAVVVLPGALFGPWDWKPSSGQMLLSIANHYTPLVPMGGISVVDVRDVARGTLSAFHCGTAGRRYILAGHNLWFRELFALVSKIVGTRPPLLPLGPINRVIAGLSIDMRYRLTGHEPLLNSAVLNMSALRLWYSSQRAADELDYRFRPVEETLRDAWNWLCEYQSSQLPPRRKMPSYEKSA